MIKERGPFSHNWFRFLFLARLARQIEPKQNAILTCVKKRPFFLRARPYICDIFPEFRRARRARIFAQVRFWRAWRARAQARQAAFTHL